MPAFVTKFAEKANFLPKATCVGLHYHRTAFGNGASRRFAPQPPFSALVRCYRHLVPPGQVGLLPAAFVPSIAGQAPFLVKNGAKSYRCWVTVIPRVATRGYSVNGRTDIARLRILTLSGSAHRTASPAGSVCAYSSPDSVGG